MKKTIANTFRRINPFGPRTIDVSELPKPLPSDPSRLLVRVFVEGYEDVAFWRGIFDRFSNPHLRFEISVPNRDDLPKGKKVLMGMIPRSSEELLLCVDSDFDYLFDGCTPQSKEVNDAEYMFHTYAYATENFLCYSPSLHNVCVKATKNDTRIFDFEKFMERYSRIIYPVFLWYVYSAHTASEHLFKLNEFKDTVRINYLDLAGNGEKTLAWVERNVTRRHAELSAENPHMLEPMKEFELKLISRGLTHENTYLFMHGHTLMDNVVIILLQTVCEKLRLMSISKIHSSRKRGVAFENEISNLKNTQRSIRDVLLDNENYSNCELFRKLHDDISSYIDRAADKYKTKARKPDL